MEATTEKIRVTVSREEFKELEISFPYYTRNKGLYCKFLSKDEAIWVCEYGFKRAIEHSKFGVPEDWLAFDPITGEEFYDKFDKVMYALTKKSYEETI